MFSLNFFNNLLLFIESKLFLFQSFPYSFSFFIFFYLFLNVVIELFLSNRKNSLIYFLPSNIMVLFYASFAFVFYFLISEYFMIFLDDITVNLTVEGLKFELTGDAFNSIIKTGGTAAVFAAGARIAAALVSKNKLTLLPKVGVITGGGTGLALTYRIITNALPVETLKDPSITVSTKLPISVQITIPKKDLLKTDEYIPLNLRNILSNSNIQTSSDGDKVIIKGEGESAVLSALDKANPNWKNTWEVAEADPNLKDQFPVNSPLEGDMFNAKVQFIVEQLTDNLYLHYIMSYLTFTLILIQLSKLLLDRNIEFAWLKGTRFGSWLQPLLLKYISIWKTGSSIWTISVLILLLFFILVSIISFHKVLIHLV